MTGTSGTSLVASGSQVSFQVARGITGLLSRHCRGIGPHLTLRGKPPGVFRVVAGGLVSSRVVSGTSGKLSCCLWEIRPPFKLWGHLRITLQSLLGNRASSRIEVEHSVVLSICNSDLMVLIEFKQGSQPCLVLRHETLLSSQGTKGVSCLLLSSGGTCAFSRGRTSESELPLCCEEILGIPFKLVQGIQALSRVEWKLGVLLTCCWNPRAPLEFQ